MICVQRMKSLNKENLKFGEMAFVYPIYST